MNFIFIFFAYYFLPSLIIFLWKRKENLDKED